MAGKKGMTHARPRTQEERDLCAKTRIEQLLDDFLFTGKKPVGWDSLRLQALKIRYDKLRASLASAEITNKTEGLTDYLKRVAQSKQEVSKPEPIAAQEPARETGQPVVH